MKNKRFVFLKLFVIFAVFLLWGNEVVYAGSRLVPDSSREEIESNETCFQYALRGGFLSWSLGERDMLTEDPMILVDLVNFYESQQGRPYWFLIAENWLACGIYSLADGRNYAGWQIGDLNLDGIVNLNDLAIYSRIRSGSYSGL